MDTRVVVCAAATAIVTGIVFGLVPALQARRKDLQQAMRLDAAARPDRVRLRQALVVGQIALTLMLLVGAGLIFQTVSRLVRTELGFSAEHLITFDLGLLERKHPRIEQQIQISERWIEQVRALPGVTSASLASQGPLDNIRGGRSLPAGRADRGATRAAAPDADALRRPWLLSHDGDPPICQRDLRQRRTEI